MSEALSALLGSIIGAIAAIAGTLIANYSQRKISKEQETKKYFIDETLDKFICRVNVELIETISLLKANDKLDLSSIQTDVLLPCVTFTDVNIHRLNELDPVLFQKSLEVIESLVNIKIAVRQIVLLPETTSSSNKIEDLHNRIEKEQLFIETTISLFGQVSAILNNDARILTKIKKSEYTPQFNEKIRLLETEKKEKFLRP